MYTFFDMAAPRKSAMEMRKSIAMMAKGRSTMIEARGMQYSEADYEHLDRISSHIQRKSKIRNAKCDAESVGYVADQEYFMRTTLIIVSLDAEL